MLLCLDLIIGFLQNNDSLGKCSFFLRLLRNKVGGFPLFGLQFRIITILLFFGTLNQLVAFFLIFEYLCLCLILLFAELAHILDDCIIILQCIVGSIRLLSNGRKKRLQRSGCQRQFGIFRL